MTDVVVRLDDDTTTRLEEHARREGCSLADLLAREARQLAQRNPYGFFGIDSSEQLRGQDLKAQLRETGFGET